VSLGSVVALLWILSASITIGLFYTARAFRRLIGQPSGVRVCPECGKLIPYESLFCGGCGAANNELLAGQSRSRRRFPWGPAVLLVVEAFALVTFVSAAFFVEQGPSITHYVSSNETAAGLADIEQSVATDAVKQYEIAKRQGDTMQICVQAGLVSAAFLQARDEPNYREWKETEHHDCIVAGVPEP
jgi:hypothetical protein